MRSGRPSRIRAARCLDARRPALFRPALFRLAALLAVLLLLTACAGTPNADTPTPAKNIPAADDVVARLATALNAGKVDGLPLSGSTAAAVADHAQTTAAMGGHKPLVNPGEIRYRGDAATATLTHSYPFGTGTWTFTSAVSLRYLDGAWKIDWQPTIMHPDLTDQTRLVHDRVRAQRGRIIGAHNVEIVWDRPVYKVGIDKSKVTAEVALESAKRLAAALNIGVDGYINRVRAGGARAFVVAVTVREGLVPVEIDTIPGALAQSGTLPLSPSPTFALGVLGTAGEATAEDIANGGGEIVGGDIVGRSGLQKMQDAALRGLAGHSVWLAPRPVSASPSPSPSAPAASAARGKETSTPPRIELFRVAPQDGHDVITTLDLDLQNKAEATLASRADVASLVVLDRSTGGLLAAANSPAAGAHDYATNGRYAPGSTFKIATSLALIRTGLTPDSPVSCTETAVAGTTRFKNYSEFPPGRLGTMSLRDAVAYSCNTAFISSSARLGANDLTTAAASLGIGQDVDKGFPGYHGSVPATTDKVVRAANTIGQGKVLASPMAMAGEAASVVAGRTIVPYLLIDKVPTSTAAPLTAQEADWLRSEMVAVVDHGSGRALKGVLTGAKTGTAEFYAGEGQTLTHAWMIGYTDKYAIAAFVEVGEAGSTVAGPLIGAFLS